jgi:hypothetical protein
MRQRFKYVGLFMSCYNWPCSCHCRFCALGQKSYSNASFSRVQDVVEKFVAWKKEQNQTGFALNLMIGPSWDMDIKRLNAYWDLCQRLDFGSARHILLNGLPLRPEDELRDWLLERKERAGLVSIELTFIGSKELQDQWRGRKGDYDYEMSAAKIASEIGLKRVERMFLTKSTIPHLSTLLDILDPIPGLSYRWMTPLNYGGWAKSMEAERITKADWDKLPERIRRYVPAAYNLKTEEDWITLLRKDYKILPVPFIKNSVRHPYETFLHLVISESNIQDLESKPCDEIVRDLTEKQEHLSAAIPDLADLTKLYGDSDNARMYRLSELENKWIDLFLNDNPQLQHEAKSFGGFLYLTSVP